MPAILPAFEYDIFISYRHNDNLDGWVTHFVESLSNELKATVKDPLTIYFDKNPEDGLLETHSVDKSLEGKLKCLIFIPILSQTYCDPKSFAWQHEFCAFIDLVNANSKSPTDGLAVRLKNGNIGSRILPIKIHDLDAEDKAAIESRIGGALRAIEFIYKEAGVNRPLTKHDNKAENQNKTDYRNQINKVANAIKEMVSAFHHPISATPALGQHGRAATSGSFKKTLAIVSATFVLMAVSFFAYKQLKTETEQGDLEKSVAVLAFADLSEQRNLEYLGDGVAEEIINVLAQSRDLKVIARSSSFQFKGKNEDLREIGKKLGVSTILEGSVRKFKDQIRVTAQLIRVSDGSHYWSKNIDNNAENLFEVQDQIANEVALALKASLLEQSAIKPRDEWNEQARELYQKGRFFYDRSARGDMNQAVVFLQKSVDIDSSHAISLSYLGAAYANIRDENKSERCFLRAEKVDPTSPQVHAGKAVQAYLKLDFQTAYNSLSTGLANGKSDPLFLRTAAFFSWLSGKPKQGVEFARRAVEVDPLIGRSYIGLIQALWYNHEYEELLNTTRKAVELFPHAEEFRAWHSIAFSMRNQFDSAVFEIKHGMNSDVRWWNALNALYYQQKNFQKLDSMYKAADALPERFQTASLKAEYLILKNKEEEAIRLLMETPMDAGTLQDLRGNLILRTLLSDKRIADLLTKYYFDKELPLN